MKHDTRERVVDETVCAKGTGSGWSDRTGYLTHDNVIEVIFVVQHIVNMTLPVFEIVVSGKLDARLAHSSAGFIVGHVGRGESSCSRYC